MSVKALEWVSGVTVGKSSYKAVLVALANFHHQKTNRCDPSIAALVQFTELNRKTVISALKWLEDAGLIKARKRYGTSSHYVLVLDQTSPKNGTASKPDTSTNFGTGTETTAVLKPVPKTAPVAELGPVPKTEPDQYQKRPGPVPNLGHKQGTGYEQGITPPNPPRGVVDSKAVADRVIERLNLQTGKKFKPVDSNRKYILARLKDGYTEEDCYQVITNRVMRWHGTSQAQYLRPSTLFNSEKFDGYLNDAGETGMPEETSQGYDPDHTTRVMREAFPEDYPEQQAALPGGDPWKH